VEEGNAMSIERLLGNLHKVKSTGRGRWMCACPSHDDKSPSMHIKLEDDGKILINCKAGCGAEDILGAIGMEFADLMPEQATHQRQKPRKNILYATEALELIRYEAQIIIATGYALRNGSLTNNELIRAEKAMQTINKCLELTK
jgi:hypothetical protein